MISGRSLVCPSRRSTTVAIDWCVCDGDLVTAHFLAFDLGAESGRALLGTLDHGVLGVDEIHRFANEPIRQNGSLRWNIVRLWQEMRRALDRNGGRRLESIGV